MTPDDRQCRQFIRRIAHPAATVAMLNRDLLAVQAELETHMRHTSRLKELRDSLVAELDAMSLMD